jgi:hypothetical protein
MEHDEMVMRPDYCCLPSEVATRQEKPRTAVSNGRQNYLRRNSEKNSRHLA